MFFTCHSEYLVLIEDKNLIGLAEGKMPTLGEYFKQERKKRGIELKDIEAKTKISAQILEFMEQDRADMLPPRAFLRGFLQVIAKEFDMDAVELIKHMEETLGPSDQPKQPFKYQKVSHWKTSLFIFIIISLFILIMAWLSLCKLNKENSTSNLTDCITATEVFVQPYGPKTKKEAILYQDYLTKINVLRYIPRYCLTTKTCL